MTSCAPAAAAATSATSAGRSWQWPSRWGQQWPASRCVSLHPANNMSMLQSLECVWSHKPVCCQACVRHARHPCCSACYSRQQQLACCCSHRRCWTVPCVRTSASSTSCGCIRDAVECIAGWQTRGECCLGEQACCAWCVIAMHILRCAADHLAIVRMARSHLVLMCVQAVES